MKINELLGEFHIFLTNEEKSLLEKVEGVRPIEFYSERERFVIENLVRKSVITKIRKNNSYMVVRNDN